MEAFAERGYHATTTRDIAGRAGMSPAALYIHYKTKEELLHRISRIGHDKAAGHPAHGGANARAPRPSGSPTPCSSFVRWHAGRRTTARVVQYELDALGPDARAEIVALRRQSDAEVRGIIEDGVAAGEFDVPDVPGTTLAVLSLCIDVARWFNVDGPPYARRGRRALRRPRAADGGRGDDAPAARPVSALRGSSATPTRRRTPACRRPRAPR